MGNPAAVEFDADGDLPGPARNTLAFGPTGPRMSGRDATVGLTATSESGGNARRLVLNPTSGEGDHVERVRDLAADRGFRVVETERAGHAVELAKRAAADGVDLLAACGGDGTIHEVVQGLVEADALADVTLCVIPAGTANIYASGLGIERLEDGFEVADRGETRELDLGVAGGEPFVMSAIAGLPAAASAAASEDLKERIGALAFVVEGLRTARGFDGLEVAIDAVADGEPFTWEGEVLCLLVGNLRRFTDESDVARAEDGALEVTIVEQVPTTDAVAAALEQRFLDRETEHVTTLEATALEVVGLEDEPVRFSLDGEISDYDATTISVRPGALRVRVPAESSSLLG